MAHTCGGCGHSPSLCNCNNGGCLGTIVTSILIMFTIALFIGMLAYGAPGIILYWLKGNHSGTAQEFLEKAMADPKTWVVSAATWVGVGIWWFAKETRIPENTVAKTEVRRSDDDVL